LTAVKEKYQHSRYAQRSTTIYIENDQKYTKTK